MSKLVRWLRLGRPFLSVRGFAPARLGGGYECPVTGETLPCPNCCPLNKS